MAVKRRSTKKCKRGSVGVKSHTRSGKRISATCRKVSRKGSRKGSRKASRKGSRKGSRKVCPPGTIRVKSHKHGSKRVKTYCRKEAVKRIQEIREDVAELREEEQAIREELEKPNCNELLGKNQCIDALDKDNLRRCRYNMKEGSCEYLPVNLRERATMQVGGSAEYKKYQAPERKKVDVGFFEGLFGGK
jgi:hypothetical protein